jgi:hypothetical protein
MFSAFFTHIIEYSHTPSYGSSTYGHFELPPFPEVLRLLRKYGSLAAWRYRPIGFQLLVSLSSVCLQPHLFALLCYTL